MECDTFHPNPDSDISVFIGPKAQFLWNKHWIIYEPIICKHLNFRFQDAHEGTDLHVSALIR